MYILSIIYVLFKLLTDNVMKQSETVMYFAKIYLWVASILATAMQSLHKSICTFTMYTLLILPGTYMHCNLNWAN